MRRYLIRGFRIRLRRTISVLLLSAVALAASGGVMSTRGTVSLNGIPAPASAAVTSGDIIVTGEDGTASVVVGGVALTIAGKSSGQFENKNLVLNQGTVRIVTTSGYTVQAGTLLVSPGTPTAKYEVARVECHVTVTATESNLLLGDKTVVKQGESATRTEPNCAAGSSHGKWIAAGAGGGAAASLPMILGGHAKKASPSKP